MSGVHKALHRTAIPLRSIAAGELGRYTKARDRLEGWNGSGFGLWAALGVSGTVFGPVAQGDGLGGGSGPCPVTARHRESLADPYV